MKLSITDKKRILDYIRTQDPKGSIIFIEPLKDYSGGKIEYSSKIVQHREIKAITGDEEWVRASLVRSRNFRFLIYPSSVKIPLLKNKCHVCCTKLN